MRVAARIALLAIPLAAAGTRSLAAQIDYRNLDDHRPVRTEDAYSIERYGFELLLPYEYENGRGAEEHHLVTPELSYGLLANTQVGLKLPFSDRGLAGPRLFALRTLNTESRVLPGFALRADLSLPVGGLAGEEPQLTLKGIATRSWGRTRLHLNGAVTLGDEAGRPDVAAEPEWVVSLAADRTFLRQSFLLVGEVGVLQAASGAVTEVTAAAGLRYQLTPTLVFDAGLARRLSANAGPDLGLTAGFSHAFAVAGLMPGDGR